MLTPRLDYIPSILVRLAHTHPRKHISRFSLALLLALFTLIIAPVPDAYAAPWGEITSDLPQDPTLTLGALPNGFRYALLPNREPAGRLSLRLLVSSGSIQENDDERGLAHFIEHMAFRGTANNPHGSLIPELEHMGISFGPDSAAFTSYDNTIYYLDLPDASETNIRKALRIFRDYATSIAFAPEDIDRERGVILSEMATRDTDIARAGTRQQAFVWPNARENTRLPIGLEKQIRRFTQKQFRAFYDAWYRPERMALIAVGAIDAEKLRNIISSEFSSITPRAPARPEPVPTAQLPVPKKFPQLEIYTDSEITGITIINTAAQIEKNTPITQERRIRELHEDLACYMFQHRLALLARQPDAITGEPSLTIERSIPGLRITSLATSGNLDQWPAVLATTEQALRSARQSGFTQNELDSAKRTFANTWRHAILAAPTRQSDDLCATLADFLLKGGGFTTPETQWLAIEKPLAEATLGDCNAAFSRIWNNATPRIFIAANKTFASVKRSQIEKVLASSQKIPVKNPDDIKPPLFAYALADTPGRIVSDTPLPDHDIHLVKFDNNVLMNFKHTDYDKNTVFTNIRIGYGRLTQPRDKPGIDQLANTAFIEGSVARHTSAEVAQLIEQHMLGIEFRVDDDALNIQLACQPAELPFALTLATAYLTDAAYRPEGRTLANAAIATAFQQQLSSPGTAIDAVAERILTRDTRFGWPSLDEPLACTMIDLRVWLAPILIGGNIEVSIVGDITLDETLRTASATLGALPPRPTRAADTPLPENSAIHFVAPTNAPCLIPYNATRKQDALSYIWPVAGPTSQHHNRACTLLAGAIENAARACLRDELGAAYAVSADYIQHDGFPNFNYIILCVEVDKATIAKADTAMRARITRIAAAGFSEDEFARTKKPFVERYEQIMHTNAYWSYTVLRNAQTNPAQLDAMRTRTADIATITCSEINTLAARYLPWPCAYSFRTVSDVK